MGINMVGSGIISFVCAAVVRNEGMVWNGKLCCVSFV